MQLLGTTLDRETIANFSFELNCIDNPNRVGKQINFFFNRAYTILNFFLGSRQNSIIPNPAITIILKDVNDNIPEVVTKSVKFNENDAKVAN